MNDEHEPHIATWRNHIDRLAGEIGPRGSTTDAERRAASYSHEVMAHLGLAPRIETFASARSAFQPHLVVAAAMLLSAAVYPLMGQISATLAALIALLAVMSETLELLFRDNLLRRLVSWGTSQNVVATLAPTSDHRQDLVLIGHLDTNHTPLIFYSNGWTNFWRIASPIMFFSFCVQAVLYTVGAVAQWPWIWPVSLESAVCAALLGAICLQAELSPFSPGANDNASGAGLVLTLAHSLSDQPLRHTRVWLVNTGCEEVKHYGSIDFFRRHQAEMVNPKVIVFEMLGRDGPAWLEYEVIIPPFAYRADPGLIALLRRVLAQSPGLVGHPTRVFGGHTEMADALRLGIPAIALIGIGPEGTPIRYRGPRLYWHHKDDTPDKIETAVLRRAYALTWAFIQALDAEAAGGRTV